MIKHLSAVRTTHLFIPPLLSATLSMSISVSFIVSVFTIAAVYTSSALAQAKDETRSGEDARNDSGRNDNRSDTRADSRNETRGDGRNGKDEIKAKAVEKLLEKKSEKRTTSEILDILDKLEYPELQVVPRASQRLKIESKDEEGSWLVMHWQMELSGLATLNTGLAGNSGLRVDLTSTQKADAAQVATVTQAVGAAWFITGLVLGFQRPYRSAMNVISKYPEKDERSILLRERLAEEALERPARFIGTVKWFSVFTNLGLNILMGTYLTDQGRIMAGVAATMSFLPLIFEDHTIMVYEKHLEYKRKIYGPLSGTGVAFDPRSNTYYPTAHLTWTF